MPAPQPVKLKVAVEPTIPVGLGTKAGGVLTLLGAVGALVAAIQANDTATITSGAGAVLVALATLGGRFAQAVVVVREVARHARPIVDALADDEQPPPSGPTGVV